MVKKDGKRGAPGSQFPCWSHPHALLPFAGAGAVRGDGGVTGTTREVVYSPLRERRDRVRSSVCNKRNISNIRFIFGF
jgi:hypothetical protein